MPAGLGFEMFRHIETLQDPVCVDPFLVLVNLISCIAMGNRIDGQRSEAKSRYSLPWCEE